MTRHFVLLGLFVFNLYSCMNSNVKLSSDEYDLIREMLDSEFDKEIQAVTGRVYRLFEELSEFHTYRLKSLNRGVDSIESSIKKYVDARERLLGENINASIWDYRELIDLVHREHSMLTELYLEQLEECSSLLYLSRKEIKTLKRQEKDETVDFEETKVKLAQFRIDPDGDLLISLIDRLFLMSQNQMLQQYENLIFSSSMCGFEVFFPVVLNERQDLNLSVGDSLKLKLGIGSYFTSVDPNTTVLLVNGDTVVLESMGLGFYDQILEREGEHEVELEFWMTNFITGEIMTGESSYIIDVNK